jgi:hypothetical protein
MQNILGLFYGGFNQEEDNNGRNKAHTIMSSPEVFKRVKKHMT